MTTTTTTPDTQEPTPTVNTSTPVPEPTPAVRCDNTQEPVAVCPTAPPVCPDVPGTVYYYTGSECVPLDHEACLEGTGAISMLPCGPGTLPATGGVDIPAPLFGFGLVAVGVVLLRISRRRWAA